MDHLIGKIVSTESIEMIRVLYPTFVTESKFDPFLERDVIYNGKLFAGL